MSLDHAAKARTGAAAIVGALVACGTAIALLAGSGSTSGDLGLAIVSGGIVGGAIVLVESMLAASADQRSAASELRIQLTSTTELNGIDLTDRQLPGIYLPGKDLVAARLLRANLAGALLFYADLRHADLRLVDLTGADLSGCTLRDADLTGAKLGGAILNDSDLRGARFDQANLRGAELAGVRASDASFDGAQLNGATLVDVNLDGANLVADGLESVRFGPIQWSESTSWPPGFEPPVSEPVSDRDLSNLGLADYLAQRRERRL